MDGSRPIMDENGRGHDGVSSYRRSVEGRADRRAPLQ